MADAQQLLDSTGERGLVVWAVPALRRQTQHAIDLWNTAIGRTWMTLTGSKADATVHVLSKNYAGDAPHSGISRADLGGEGAGPLTVWINPDTTPDYLLPVITHELGHSLGLDDAYRQNVDNPGATNRMSNTPSNRGTMSANVAPGPTEGAQARGDQGLAAPFYWSPEAQAAYQGGQGVQVAEWAKDFSKEGSNWSTAASLVAAGVSARGVGLGYTQSRFVQDVATMAHTLVPTNRYSQDEGPVKQRVRRQTPSAKVGAGGGQQNERKM